MTKLYIPRLRDRLKITADWTFPVYLEHRNEALIAHMGYGYGTAERDIFLQRLDKEKGTWYYRGDQKLPKPFTMPAGTVLSVDRIYMRNGYRDYDSVTFRCKLPHGKKQVSVRFWAKLDDVNGLEFEPAPPEKPVKVPTTPASL